MTLDIRGFLALLIIAAMLGVVFYLFDAVLRWTIGDLFVYATIGIVAFSWGRATA